MTTALSGKQRSFGRGLLLTIVTLGLYSFYWHYKAYKEVYDQERRTDFPMVAWVLSLIPFINIVGYIWLHVVAIDGVNAARKSKGLQDGTNAVEFILWNLVGWIILVGPFIGYYKLQSSINQYWEAAAKVTLSPTAPTGAPPMRAEAP